MTVLRQWLRVHAPLRFWQFISLFTSSFVAFQFQFPGDPDILAFTFLLLVMSPGFSQRSKTSFLVLALITHEATLFIGSLLAWRFLNKKHFTFYLMALALYASVWLVGFRVSLESLLSSHNVDGMSGVEWVFQNPTAAALGIFMAFKILWILPLLAVIIDSRERQWGRVIFIGLGSTTGVLLAFLAADTSRMVGWAFPAILMSLETIRSISHLERLPVY